MRSLNLIISLPFLFSTISPKAQPPSQTLDVAAWNIEWFGAPFQNPPDDVQEQNVIKTLRWLNADIYGLCEVVDTAALRRVTDSLGANFRYVISDYCSNAGSPIDSDWLNGQKLAFIYNSDIFSNITTRGFLRNSSNAYYSFASGRYPFLFSANATINNNTRPVHFIMMHGKAGSGNTDYNRRREGAREMKDSLDAHYANATVFLIGDFNDDFDETISTGSGPESSYHPIVSDSTDNDHYRSILIYASNEGQQSMISYSNVVDHHLISNEAYQYYIPGSALIRTDINSIIPDYHTGNTSDHYPITSRYNLNQVITSLPQVPPQQLGLRVFPNPAKDLVNVHFGKSLKDVSISLCDADGKIFYIAEHKIISSQTSININLPPARGIYFLKLQTDKAATIVRIAALDQ